MVRWLTAGESHGPALTGIVEGLPAGIPVTTQDVQDALARRRLGYGRGARMKFEQDAVTILGGVRHGRTLGSPVAIQVGNTEWPKWEKVMAADPVPAEELDGLARNAALTRPRPGHADLTGMQKYGFDEARPLLERASARETAARVALGTVARAFLGELGVRIVSHTVAFGEAALPEGHPFPVPEDEARLDADPVRCLDPQTSAAMVAEVDDAHRAGETLGGVVEVLAYGVPIGLGSHVHWDRRLDARLAGALMGIQAIKGVQVGDGFATAARRGSAAHDGIARGADGRAGMAALRAKSEQLTGYLETLIRTHLGDTLRIVTPCSVSSSVEVETASAIERATRSNRFTRSTLKRRSAASWRMRAKPGRSAAANMSGLVQESSASASRAARNFWKCSPFS